MEKYLIPILTYTAAALFGYLVGCFNLSYLLAKRRGFDIRTKGTNNPGASNAAVTMGWKIGVLVGFCDIMKGFLAVLAVRLLIGEEYSAIAPYFTGIMCVVGHMHPFYLKFKGGKGFATYLGMIMAIDWKFFLILVAAMFIAFIITDYIVMGTMLTMVSFPIYSILFHRGLIAIILASALSAYIIFKHRKNLVDIFYKRERKISEVFKKKK